MNKETVKLYCPHCKEIYNPTEPNMSTLDGAYFGTSFPHLYLMQYPDFIDMNDGDEGEIKEESKTESDYKPKIFGLELCNENVEFNQKEYEPKSHFTVCKK